MNRALLNLSYFNELLLYCIFYVSDGAVETLYKNNTNINIKELEEIPRSAVISAILCLGLGNKLDKHLGCLEVENFHRALYACGIENIYALNE